MRSKLTDDDMKIIVKRYKTKESPASIAKDYNVSEDTIRNRLKKLGVYTKGYYGRYSYDECIDILNLYNQSQWDILFEKYPKMNRQAVYTMSSAFNNKKEEYFWSDDEIQWLIDNYKTASKSDIEKRYNGRHNYKAVQTKARMIGLAENRSWSDEEIKIIEANYSSIPIKEFVKLLPKRSYDSIVGMARKLGIRSYDYIKQKYSNEQKKFIMENFGILTDAEMSKILDKPIIGIQQQRHNMGLYIIAKDYSGYENVAKFLRGHLQDQKNKSMELCNYQCILTGSKNYSIHHLYSFNKIFEETMQVIEKSGMKLSNKIEDYTKEQLDYILNVFLEVHNKYPYGICVRNDIHDLFHEIYGSGSNTENQWNIFVNNLQSGKYNIKI